MKTKKGYFTHEWMFDLPWHMVDLKDWFYMVNAGYIEPTVFLHVRVLGLRSLWTFKLILVHDRSILEAQERLV